MGRALRELGVEMIPVYSPQARDRAMSRSAKDECRSSYARLYGITTVEAANRLLFATRIAEFNQSFEPRALPVAVENSEVRSSHAEKGTLWNVKSTNLSARVTLRDYKPAHAC